MDAAEQSGQRPVILVCCAIADARNSVAEELERRYSADYRIASAGSALQATTALRDSAEHGEKVALLLADQPTGMSDDGALFAEARRLFPDVRRGALIEWGFWGDRATTGSVLQLMAAGRIDYYVIRPWHSPDEYFHRTVTEFLLEWERAIGDRPREVTVIGDDTQPRTHELRSRLARGGVPHAYASPETEGGRRMLAESGVAYAGVPLVRLLDGRIISDPRDAELARAYGLTTELPADEEVDVAIVGAGPAGLAAAVYAASEGLRSLVVERESIGGQAGSSSLIRNYLGFSRGISGSELAARAYQQAWVFGAGFVHSREAVGIQSSDGGFLLTVAPGEQVRARSVVIAVGVSYRRLTVADLAAYVGVFVFYGASAVEAAAQAGRTVHVVGGGNSAGQAALHLARYAERVSLLVRGKTLADSMSKYLIDQLEAAGVRVVTSVEVVGGGHGDHLDHLVLRDHSTEAERNEQSDALFVLIGAAPHTEWLPESVLRDRWGYILTGNDVLEEGGHRAWPHERLPGALETSVAGIFAVGDVRRGSVKRVASAVGEGSVVVSAVHSFLNAAHR
ncbi:FAD-dependent oxidoreductase [Glaciibacter superstes]|uniref:FAD-dependent oxidoreductase n=1 Tax=Glaciibacter superstes TaxID=501023 RepID=UPI0003B5A171|nr:FAD-dependent oxidoreductase [Glaciibacter superstes]